MKPPRKADETLASVAAALGFFFFLSLPRALGGLRGASNVCGGQFAGPPARRRRLDLPAHDHKVATAMTGHRREARWGSVTLV